MNKKTVFLLIFLLGIIIPALAQHGEQAAIEEISKAAAGIRTLHCQFKQTKQSKMLNNGAMLSEGEMWYRQPDCLCWEYQSPYPSAFILSGGKMQLRRDKSSRMVSLNHSKKLKEMARIMIPGELGKSLLEKGNFEVSAESKDTQHILQLLPQSKELKQMFTRIVLYYNRPQAVVEKVEMWEKNGESTTIELSFIIINEPISDTVFDQNRQ